MAKTLIVIEEVNLMLSRLHCHGDNDVRKLFTAVLGTLSRTMSRLLQGGLPLLRTQ